MNPGTIIIDMGWAENPALGLPSKRRWIDMRDLLIGNMLLDVKFFYGIHLLLQKALSMEMCMTLEGKDSCTRSNKSSVSRDIEGTVKNHVIR